MPFNIGAPADGIGSGGVDTGLEDQFNLVANHVALAIECGAVFVAAFGALQAMLGLLKAIATGQATGLQGAKSGSALQPGSCSPSNLPSPPTSCRPTAVAPTWDDISKLAVIATIRTMLNYFLAKDIMAFDEARDFVPKVDTN